MENHAPQNDDSALLWKCYCKWIKGRDVWVSRTLLTEVLVVCNDDVLLLSQKV